MSSRPRLVPGPDHPITVTPGDTHVVIRVGDRIVADSRSALTLKESHYPAVLYIPRSDVDMTLLEPSTHRTYCPYKGDCSYFSIAIDGERRSDAVWSYEHPFPAVAEIKDHLAFYPDRVDSITIG
ncbi:DUF427 domain-containing protein [Flavisphingomonas formosensis]|uniref:DUF427 domain-containing protein n=1 Tax=Flavisphingomonas formosensis TaxID=861534 RepID=UPI0012FC177C|nr:DUF427 domain-containing protein [Sphingomonas formosensis]